MKIKELLSDSSKWTKRAMARDFNDLTCVAHCDIAIKWCLLGAIVKCYPGGYKRIQILNKIIDNGISDISGFNDLSSTSFSDIKALVERLDI